MNTTTVPETARAADATRRRAARRVIIRTGLGNALEWYDWTIYATFAPLFAPQMFSNEDPTSAVLSTLAIFAVGFLMRPLGALVFGWIADKKGRRFSLTLAMLLVAVGSLAVALAPTFAVAGVGASLILLTARLVQGLAHGGEVGSVYTYIAEMAPATKRGLWSSSVYMFVTAGVLGANLLGVALKTVLPPEFMTTWGWRIPFLIGAMLGLYAMFLRRALDETVAFENTKSTPVVAPRSAYWAQLWRYRLAALTVIAITCGGTVVFYTWNVYAPTYATTALHIDATGALWAGIAAQLIFIASLPLFGMISDRIGRRPMVFFFTVAFVVLAFPVQWLLRDSPWQLFASMTIVLLSMAPANAIIPAMFAELFPTSVRAAGLGLPYAITTALFGGTAPYLNTWLSSIGLTSVFTLYAMVLVAIGGIVTIFVAETKGKDLTQP